jgi:hypothetical protein
MNKSLNFFLKKISILKILIRFKYLTENFNGMMKFFFKKKKRLKNKCIKLIFLKFNVIIIKIMKD